MRLSVTRIILSVLGYRITGLLYQLFVRFVYTDNWAQRIIRTLRKQVKELERANRRLKEENEFLAEASAFFRREPSEVSKEQRMRFVAKKTDGGERKDRIFLYCRILEISRQGFYRYLARQDRPWKYQGLADAMRAIHNEDLCNDTYGRRRMRQALFLAQLEGVRIPSEGTVRRLMERIGLVRRPKRRPNGVTKADRVARKSDDLLKRDFQADKPPEKCVTDITEIKAKDGKLYVSAMFDCFDLTVLGLAEELKTLVWRYFMSSPSENFV